MGFCTVAQYYFIHTLVHVPLQNSFASVQWLFVALQNYSAVMRCIFAAPQPVRSLRAIHFTPCSASYHRERYISRPAAYHITASARIYSLQWMISCRNASMLSFERHGQAFGTPNSLCPTIRASGKQSCSTAKTSCSASFCACVRLSS